MCYSAMVEQRHKKLAQHYAARAELDHYEDRFRRLREMELAKQTNDWPTPEKLRNTETKKALNDQRIASDKIRWLKDIK